MLLRLEEQEFFIKCASLGKLLYVNGINYLGQEFKTIAKVMTGDASTRDDYYVESESIAFFLGQRDKTTGEKLYVVMHTCLDGEAGEYRSLYIDKVKDEKGKVVYANPSYEEIVKIVKQNAMPVYGRKSKMTDLEKRVANCIACPVIVRGVKCTIIGVNRWSVRTASEPYVHCSTGDEEHNVPINARSVETDNRAIRTLVSSRNNAEM